MQVTIDITCCEGKEVRSATCRKGACPIYARAKSALDDQQPFVPTGFGNLFGNSSSHRQVLDRVRGIVEVEKGKSKNRRSKRRA